MQGEVLLLKGERFTPCSEALFNGRRVDSWFFDEQTLLLTQPPREPGSFCVAQFTDSGAELSRTEEIEYDWQRATGTYANPMQPGKEKHGGL